jgi:predicted AAA+ superfamily ATPase
MTMEATAPYIERIIELPTRLAKKSHFLLGPRQTGKSFLIAHTLPGVRLYDLLDSATYFSLSHDPTRLAQELTT